MGGRRRTAEQLEEAAAKLRAEAAERRRRVAAMEAIDAACKAIKAGNWDEAFERLGAARALAVDAEVVS